MSQPTQCAMNLQGHRILEWAYSESFEPVSITRDSQGRMTSASVRWPDNSFGVLTIMARDAATDSVDSFTLTYPKERITVYKDAPTRNADGLVTYSPPMRITQSPIP